MSRNEDLCPLALLCANQIVSDDGKHCLPFPLLGCPVPRIGRHYKQMLHEDVWSTFVHMGPSGNEKKKWIELYDISFNRIHWKLFKASFHFHWRRRKSYAFEIPTNMEQLWRLQKHLGALVWLFWHTVGLQQDAERTFGISVLWLWYNTKHHFDLSPLKTQHYGYCVPNCVRSFFSKYGFGSFSAFNN